MDHLDFPLGPLGQLPSLQIYTQICFVFAVPPTVAPASIANTLTDGLSRLSAAFPWLAGQVALADGVYAIHPLAAAPQLVVKDLRDDADAPTLEQLRRDDYPMRLLDEDTIAPRRTLPADAAPQPVLLVQANLIAGGLILTVNGQHATMDMTGQGVVLRLLSKACRGEPFTEEELRTGNCPREAVIPLYDEPYVPGPEMDAHTVRPATDPPEAVPASWAYFSFSAASLAALKTAARETLPCEDAFVSTDDAVSALLWQAVARARRGRRGPSAPSAFARAVDMRRNMGAPPSYPGVLQALVYTASPSAPGTLGALALALRRALDPAALVDRTRGLATCLARSPDDRACLALGGAPADVMLSSWAKVGYCWGLDFGLALGMPLAVRRPRFTPVESLMYLMPRRPDGEISAAVSLRDEDLERLRKDAEFGRYARYIG